MSSPERRTAPRHTPLHRRVFLGWMEEDQPQFTRGRLSDLSSGGAGVSIPIPLPTVGDVWLGLEGTPTRDWVQSEAVWCVPSEMGLQRIGLRFVTLCPVEFFRRAIWGFTAVAAEGVALASPEGEPARVSYSSSPRAESP